ncbi:phosphotransferase [Saccharopolyspora shandongensis]|uniref:phosphotransferase n=1 Tax=Saccharopolyspora shandongensis TaxID=418495 RepID=UPI00343DBFC9
MADTTVPVVTATQSSAVFDVRENGHEDVLDRAERALDVRLDRSSVVYGEHGATEGFRTSSGTWARVERRQRWRINSAVWIGLEAAATIRGVKKPEWFQSATWSDPARDVVWRVDEVELINAPVVGDLATATTLPDPWWTGLCESLAALGAHPTERVGMSQAHLTKRITEVFDGVDTVVDEWTTAHTDLHWGNLSVEGHIIDWEDWGAAPRGHDAATLWQSALPDPQLAARVQHEFAADLETRSGKLAQLLQCANAIRVAARRGASTPLSEPARAAADVLLAELRGA